MAGINELVTQYNFITGAQAAGNMITYLENELSKRAGDVQKTATEILRQYCITMTVSGGPVSTIDDILKSKNVDYNTAGIEAWTDLQMLYGYESLKNAINATGGSFEEVKTILTPAAVSETAGVTEIVKPGPVNIFKTILIAGSAVFGLYMLGKYSKKR